MWWGVYAIPVTWQGFWQGMGDVNNILGGTVLVLLPFFLNMGHYRLSSKAKDWIRAKGGRTWIQRVDGTNYEFVMRNNQTVQRSLYDGTYWYKDGESVYRYDTFEKAWKLQ